MAKKIYVIAGEASGDLHGAELIANLRQASKEPLEIYGVGGDRILKAGAKDFIDLAHFHVTALTQAILKAPRYYLAARAILSSIRKRRPHLVVLIDNPGFNLRLAKKIHKMKLPIVYYISPQLWAWNYNRIHLIKKVVSKMLVFFEFEKKIYEQAGVPVDWIGNPLKDLIEEKISTHKHSHEKRPGQICLLPGSRRGEINYLLPVLLKAAQQIAGAIPESHFVLIKSPTMQKSFYDGFLSANPVPNLKFIELEPYEAMRKSMLAISCSGTATLECALLGTPAIVTNKANYLNYLVVKSVIRIPYLGMPNIILGEKKFAEFLQDDATPENLSAEAIRILRHPAVYASMQQDLLEVCRRLGPPGASLRAACSILAVLYQQH